MTDVRNETAPCTHPKEKQYSVDMGLRTVIFCGVCDARLGLDVGRSQANEDTVRRGGSGPL